MDVKIIETNANIIVAFAKYMVLCYGKKSYL